MKTLLFLIFFSFCVSALAVEIDLQKIAKIESSGNPAAFNKRTGATGKYQITKICLADYNQYHKTAQYTMKEMFEENKNEIVARWYFDIRIPQLLRYYHKEINIKNILTAYNAGIAYTFENKILPNETKNYIDKYMRCL